MTAGEEHRKVMEKVALFADKLAQEEEVRLQLERRIGEKVSHAATREQELSETLEATTLQAEFSQGMLRRLRRKLWLRRQLLTSPAGNQSGSTTTNTVVIEEAQCSTKSAEQKPEGICTTRKGSDQTRNTSPAAATLRKSIVEAMQILSPTQDLAIGRMHADLCLAQLSASSDPCNASLIFNASSWCDSFKYELQS